MISDGKKTSIERYAVGERLGKTSKLNQPIDALNAMNRGADLPGRGDATDWPLDIPAPYKKARLVITAARALAGLTTIDGKTPAIGDYILVATGGAPGTDGLYEASAGNWTQLVRLNFNQTGNVPVYPHGTDIWVWDGTTSPRVFVAGVTGLATF